MLRGLFDGKDEFVRRAVGRENSGYEDGLRAGFAGEAEIGFFFGRSGDDVVFHGEIRSSRVNHGIDRIA